MLEPTKVDEWLDRWEDLQDSGKAVPLDEFISRHCKGASPKLIARFVDQVRKLAAINAKLEVNTTNQAGGETQKGMTLRPGYEPIPGHVLVSRLGHGGYGEVWKAKAPGGFHVALKFVRLDRRVRTPELRALNTIKEIRHPNLLSVFGAYQNDSYLIISMELAERTIQQRFNEVRAQGLPGIPREELLEYAAEAAKGLDYLNEPHHPSEDGTLRGIQHRDIKPQNLLLFGGSLKVGDFGLVRCLEHSQTSHTGSLTPAYAPPEFFNGQTFSSSDQYSLAVTYCLLRGGRLPFKGSPAELMAGHLSREPDLSMLPDEERQVVRTALAKEPNNRWSSCGAFVKALREVELDQATMKTPASAPSTERPRKRPLAGIAAMVAFVLLLAPCMIVAGLVGWSMLGGKKEPLAKEALANNDKSPADPASKKDSPPGDVISSKGKGDKPPKKDSPARAQRGFGDTILKYEERSYQGLQWKVIQSSDSLGLKVKSPGFVKPRITLQGVVGWDDDSFWVTANTDAYTVLAFRFLDNTWSCVGDRETNSILKTRQRLLDRDTLLFATGNRLYQMSPSGTIDFGKGLDYAHKEWGEICPVAPDLSFLFISKFHPSYIVTEKTRTQATEDKATYVYHAANFPNAQRKTGGIKHTRALAPGKVVGIHPGSGNFDDTDDAMIVTYRDGTWYETAPLPKGRVNDVWVCGTNGSPDFLVAVAGEGKICTQEFGGPRRELTVPVTGGATSLFLIKVWGVSLDKFWVLDASGTIWERKGTGWRTVVQGLNSGPFLTDAWISPTGNVIAISGGHVFRLE